MTSIAAIVCGHTLDRWGDIQRAIESLRNQTTAPDQIIFSVDNNDELYAAASAEFGDLTVVHNTGRRGVSGARNTAARASHCDVLAFLDDDAVADAAWIEHLLPWYVDPSVLGVGGHAEPAWDGAGPRWFPAAFNWVVGCSHSGITDTPAPVRNFIGCNMSIRRAVWETVGGFDESIGRVGADGGGGDETDFCIRVTNTLAGTIMNDPRAIVSHRVPADRQTWSYFIKRCRSEGRSKAQIAAHAGNDKALSEERNHLLTELPRSFVRGLLDAAQGDFSGVGRASAIVVGTTATGIGFVTGSLTKGNRSQPARLVAGFEPVQIVRIDLDDRAAPLDVRAGEPLMVIAKRGKRLVGVERHDAAPTSEQLRSTLEARYPVLRDPPNEHDPNRSAAVVIATKDRTDSLRRCLESLAAMTTQPAQIIVVDNRPSTDASERMLAEWNTTATIAADYVRCERPGLGAAHNAALPHLRGDIAAFTDDDVVVDEHWLDQILAAFGTDDDVACVTGSILPASIETWPQAWVESTSNYSKGMSSRRFSLANPPDDPLFPFTAGSMGSGANMAFRTAWLRDHPFDDALGTGTKALGGDDLRAFYEVVASGRALIFTPHAMIYHDHHRTAEAIDRQAYGYGAGLGAYLASVVLDEPATMLGMIRRAPRAVAHARSVTSAPPTLSFPGDKRRSRSQRIGLLSGPFRYIRSRI